MKHTLEPTQPVDAEPQWCSDGEIAGSVADVLAWDISVPRGKVKARVENGWVTLEGAVAFPFQRRAAKVAVRRCVGVKGVSNLIAVAPPARPAELERLDPACRHDG
jgi:osmotically-inducible protein OsmY